MNYPLQPPGNLKFYQHQAGGSMSLLMVFWPAILPKENDSGQHTLVEVIMKEYTPLAF